MYKISTFKQYILIFYFCFVVWSIYLFFKKLNHIKLIHNEQNQASKWWYGKNRADSLPSKNVIKSIQRIKQSTYDKTISLNPNQLECRLDILKSYIDTAMSLQSDLDFHDPKNDDRAELEEIWMTTKSLFFIDDQ